MKNTVNEFLERNPVARWRVLGLSTLITALIGFTSESLGMPTGKAQLLAALIGSLSFWKISDSFTHKAATVTIARTARLGSPEVIRWRGPILAGVFGITVLAAVPTLKAAVLNHRLEVLLSTPPSAKRSSETVQVLKLAAQSHTKLRPDLVSAAKVQTERPLSLSQGVESPAANLSRDQWLKYVVGVARQFNARNPRVDHQSSAQFFQEMPLPGRLTNDTFGDMRIVYDGRPIVIENTCFGSVALDVEDNANGRALLQALDSSKDGCISLNLSR